MKYKIQEFIYKHKYPKFEPKAFFFDMDGVLFNSMPYHAKAWAEIMRNHGLNFTEYDAYLNEGRTGDSTIDEFFTKDFGHAATSVERKEIYDEKNALFEKISNHSVEPVNDVFNLLKIIKQRGLDIFVVTGSGNKNLIDKLNKYFPDIFDSKKMVTAFDVKYGKPNPEPYLIALQKAKVEPWQAVVIENAPLGVISAVGAGIFTVAVNTGILKDEELAKAGANIIFSDMKTLILQINNLICDNAN